MQMNYTSICIWSWTIMTPMHAWTHERTHTHTHAYTQKNCTRTYTHMNTCTHTQTYAHRHTHEPTDTQTRAHTYSTHPHRRTDTRACVLLAFVLQDFRCNRTHSHARRPHAVRHIQTCCAHTPHEDIRATPVHRQIRTHHINQGTCWRPLSIRETTKVCFRFLHSGSFRVVIVWTCSRQRWRETGKTPN